MKVVDKLQIFYFLTVSITVVLTLLMFNNSIFSLICALISAMGYFLVYCNLPRIKKRFKH